MHRILIIFLTNFIILLFILSCQAKRTLEIAQANPQPPAPVIPEIAKGEIVIANLIDNKTIEDGSTATFDVSLNMQPSSNIEILISTCRESDKYVS